MHGILNIVGWGVMLPIGVIVARYCRIYPFNIGDDTWFYLHVSCQIAGYVIGTTAWGIGLGLGHSSRHYTFRTHRLLGIFIFTFATLQVNSLNLSLSTLGRRSDDMLYFLFFYFLCMYVCMCVYILLVKWSFGFIRFWRSV